VYAYNLSHSAPASISRPALSGYPNPARGDVSNIQVFVAENATLDLTLFNSSKNPFKRSLKRLAQTKNILIIGTFPKSPMAFILR